MHYKYRSLKEFRFFVDIILNQRLYTSPYFELNDPMEGRYLYTRGELSSELIRAIKGDKEKIRICSLSKDPEHPLMWAHYADGHRGVAIGVRVSDRYDVIPVEYNDSLPNINMGSYVSAQTAKEILCHKLRVWEYEKEERVFISKGNYINVIVKEVRLGSKMKKEDKNFLHDLIGKISPEIQIIDSISKRIY